MRISDWSSDVCSSDLEIEDRLSFLEQHVPEHGDVRPELEELSDELLSWMLTDIHVALERVVMAEAARFPALARNLYEFGVGRTTRLVAEVLRKAEERGEIRVSDANFAAEQFISSVILSRSEEHTSELQSLMRISYAVFCLKKKTI